MNGTQDLLDLAILRNEIREMLVLERRFASGASDR